MQARSTTSLLQGGSRQHRTHPCPPGGIGIRQHAALRGARWARAARPRLQPAGALPPPDEPHQQQQQQQQQHQLLQPMIQVPPPDSSSPGGGGERRAMTEPANTSLAPPQDSDTLAAQVEAERGEEERESFITESGLVEEVEEQDAQFDYLGETTEGNLHLVQRLSRDGMVRVFGLNSREDILTVPVADLAAATQSVLDELEVPHRWPAARPERGVFCSRTLNLRSIKAIGYDMDYTCVHYDVDAWEGRAYAYGLETLRASGVPVDGLRFDPDLVIRGLIIDIEYGNIIKVDRFGLVKRAMHGTRMLSWQEIRQFYGREVVNLRHEGRWVFLNTLFSVSEAVMYMQLVDRLDYGAFTSSSAGAMSYTGLYRLVSKALYRTHVEGKLKREIMQAPEKFVQPDPEMAATLLDQKEAGKMLLLITNSDYEYTSQMMSFAYDPHLPRGMTWRDLFDMVIVMARKPEFFSYNMPLYEVVTPDGLMRPVLAAKRGGLYCGGSAKQVEAALGVEGDDILYVGDHIYTDAALAKINFRWRTALVIRELEAEVVALATGRPHRDALKQLMVKKEIVGDLLNHLRLARQRAMAAERDTEAAAAAAAAGGRAPGGSLDPPASLSSFGPEDEEALNDTLGELLLVLEQLEERIGPMLERDGHPFNSRWGYLSRAGLNDKSQLIRQIEKYADVYTSRVSNFLRYSPYMYFRSPSQSLAHDRNLTGYYKTLAAQQAAAAAAQGGAGGARGAVPRGPAEVSWGADEDAADLMDSYITPASTAASSAAGRRQRHQQQHEVQPQAAARAGGSNGSRRSRAPSLGDAAHEPLPPPPPQPPTRQQQQPPAQVGRRRTRSTTTVDGSGHRNGAGSSNSVSGGSKNSSSSQHRGKRRAASRG